MDTLKAQVKKEYQTFLKEIQKLIIFSYEQHNAHLLSTKIEKSGFYCLITTVLTPTDVRVYKLPKYDENKSMQENIIECIRFGDNVENQIKYSEMFPKETKVINIAYSKINNHYRLP